MSERILIERLVTITPDTAPSYWKLADGRWALHDKVYPVPKPPLGPAEPAAAPSAGEGVEE
jgi:hypothetical protein